MSFLAQRAPWGPRPFGSFLGALAKFGLGQEAGPVRRRLVTVVPLRIGGRTSHEKALIADRSPRGPQSPAVKGRADPRSGSAPGVPTSGTLRAACCPSFGNGRMPSDRNGLDLRSSDEVASDLHHIGPDTPLRLERAIELAFPAGGMTVSGLRREAKKGRLTIEVIAGSTSQR